MGETNMWLILNKLENVIDAKIGVIHESIESKEQEIEKLLEDRQEIGELRKIEKRLSKRGMI